MWFRALVNPAAQALGHYTAYQLHESEYVGDLNVGSGIRTLLGLKGYEPSPRLFGIPLEAAKWHWDDRDQTPGIALRKIDPEDERRQYHIHLFGRWDGVDLSDGRYSPVTYEVASHHELRPDVRRLADETFGEMKQRLRKHYRAVEYERGEVCDDLDDALGSIEA